MTYQFHADAKPAEIDAFVQSSDQNSLFQCSPWAAVKNNWEHLFTCVTEEGRMVGSALVLIRPMPLHTTLFYIPRGPVMDYNRADLVQFYLSQLVSLAKSRHAIAVRFDPKILSRKYPYKERMNPQEYRNQDVIDLLKSCGAVHRGFTVRIEESTQPRFNAEMDIIPDYRSTIEHKTVHAFETAERKGVEVYQGTEVLHDFATAMHYTEVRKKVALRKEDYFRNMMDVYQDHAICMVAKLNFARQLKRLEESIAVRKSELEQKHSRKELNQIRQMLQEDETEQKRLMEDQKRENSADVITCGILACYNSGIMELFYMGNNPDYMRMKSSYLLYDRCLAIAAEKGIPECSFGGIEGTLDDGLTLFKSNFPMNVEEYIGEFNLVLNKPLYKGFDETYPKMLKLAANLRGKA
jgi:serine/alanine adding enzyme